MQPWPSVSRGKPFLRAGRAGEPHSSRPAARSHAAWSRCEDAREAAAPQVGSDLVPAAGPAAARPDCPAPAQGAETSLPGRGQGPAPLALREAPACPLRDLPPPPSPRRLFVSCFYLFNLRRSVCRRRKPWRQCLVTRRGAPQLDVQGLTCWSSAAGPWTGARPCRCAWSE